MALNKNNEIHSPRLHQNFFDLPKKERKELKTTLRSVTSSTKTLKTESLNASKTFHKDFVSHLFSKEDPPKKL